MEKCEYSTPAMLAEGEGMAGPSLCAATTAASPDLHKVPGFGESKTTQCSFSIESILGMDHAEKDTGFLSRSDVKAENDLC